MELEGTVTGGMIVPDTEIEAPDGTRVRFEAFSTPGLNPTKTEMTTP